MSYALQKCPRCNKEFTGPFTTCPYCGYTLILPFVPSPIRGYSESSSATSISGEIFDVPSPIYIDPSFTTVAEHYDNDVEAEIPEDILTKDISKSTLEDYRKKGYLKKIGNKYVLTDLGKDYYQRNKEFRDKIEENKKKIQF